MHEKERLKKTYTRVYVGVRTALRLFLVAQHDDEYFCKTVQWWFILI